MYVSDKYYSLLQPLAPFLQDTFSSIVSPPSSSRRSDYAKTSSCQFPVGGKSQHTSYTTSYIDGNHSLSARTWNARDSMRNHSQCSEPTSAGQQSPLEYHNSETNDPSSAHSLVHPVSRYIWLLKEFLSLMAKYSAVLCLN